MYEFKVNGQPCHYEKNIKLLEYLRDILHLTAAKDGCGEGACGACTVLINGNKAKACVFTLSQIVGMEVITVEGIEKEQMDVYVECFGKAGAVQCGFCIPGMIISAKSLLDKNLNPTREEIKQAINGNICRCTGYKRIEDAIFMAAEKFREKKSHDISKEICGISREYTRIDVKEKVMGTGLYVDDITLPGMLYAKALRTPYPRAKIIHIDIEAARQHPDCEAVFTAKDIPSNVGGHIVPDWDVMIEEGKISRYIGDAIALVVSKSKDTLDEILKKIVVEAEELSGLFSPVESLKEDAPKIHEKGNLLTHEFLKRGDAKGAIEKSKYVVTRHYSLPFTDHAFMEPECAIAYSEGADKVHLITAGQSIYDEQREVSRMLNLPQENVIVESALVGGGFGGKEDMTVQHHCALAAFLLKKPVKIKFSREESLSYHVKRHAMEMDFTTACDEQGYLTGMTADIYSDTGAYASLGGPVLQRACTHAAGPYNYHNIDINGYAVYTNNIPAGAYRGFGVTQSCFGIENNINILADMVGISPWQFRYQNAVRPGDILPNGQIVTVDCAFRQTLEAVKEVYESEPYAGIASCMKNSGIGVGLPDIGKCNLLVKDKKVHIQTSAACIGQGMGTVCVQIVGETTGLSGDAIMVERPNTERTPDSGTTTASRQTLFTGEAVHKAAILLKAALDEGKSLENLDGKSFYGEYYGKTDPMGSKEKNPVSHIAYGYATQVVVLDEKGFVKKIVAAHDVGTPINIQAAKGQIEGGAIMGLGYGLTEDFPVKKGYPVLDYAHLGLFRAGKTPPVEAILITSKEVLKEAYGAKGVGEISSVATAPACAHAYYRLDRQERTSLPLVHTAYRP